VFEIIYPVLDNVLCEKLFNPRELKCRCFFHAMTGMGYAIKAADWSWTSQVVRVREYSASFASAITAANMHKVSSIVFA